MPTVPTGRDRRGHTNMDNQVRASASICLTRASVSAHWILPVLRGSLRMSTVCLRAARLVLCYSSPVSHFATVPMADSWEEAAPWQWSRSAGSPDEPARDAVLSTWLTLHWSRRAHTQSFTKAFSDSTLSAYESALHEGHQPVFRPDRGQTPTHHLEVFFIAFCSSLCFPCSSATV